MSYEQCNRAAAAASFRKRRNPRSLRFWDKISNIQRASAMKLPNHFAKERPFFKAPGFVTPKSASKPLGGRDNLYIKQVKSCVMTLLRLIPRFSAMDCNALRTSSAAPKWDGMRCSPGVSDAHFWERHISRHILLRVFISVGEQMQ